MLDLLTKGSKGKGAKKKDEKVKSETPQMQTTRERCLKPIMRWFHAPASAHPTNIDSKTEYTGRVFCFAETVYKLR